VVSYAYVVQYTSTAAKSYKGILTGCNFDSNLQLVACNCEQVIMWRLSKRPDHVCDDFISLQVMPC